MILTHFLCCDGSEIDYQLEEYFKQGITRIEIDDEVYSIEDVLKDKKLIAKTPGQNLVIDRIITKNDENSLSRFADSIQTTFSIGKGICIIKAMDGKEEMEFSDRFELDDIIITEIGGTVGDIESLPYIEAVRQLYALQVLADRRGIGAALFDVGKVRNAGGP